MREAKIGAERAVREALGFGSGGKRRLVDGLIKVDMEMKSNPPEHVWQPYEDILQRDLVCPHCTLDHSVYGFAIWCPDCGKDIFTTHVRGEIRVIEAIVGDVGLVVLVGVPAADALPRVLADRQVSPTVLSNSLFAMREVCAGNLSASIPPSLRFGATGSRHLNFFLSPALRFAFSASLR